MYVCIYDICIYVCIYMYVGMYICMHFSLPVNALPTAEDLLETARLHLREDEVGVHRDGSMEPWW